MKDNEQKKATKKFAEYWKDRGYEKAAEPIDRMISVSPFFRSSKISFDKSSFFLHNS